MPRLLALAASASGIWSTARPLKGYNGQTTRTPSPTSASTRLRRPSSGLWLRIDLSFSLISAPAVSLKPSHYRTQLTRPVPVIKTVLKFAANRIAFNPMEAMNLAVASEGWFYPPNFQTRLTPNRSQRLCIRCPKLQKGPKHPQGPCGCRHGRRVLPDRRGARDGIVRSHSQDMAPRPGSISRYLPYQADAEVSIPFVVGLSQLIIHRVFRTCWTMDSKYLLSGSDDV